MTQEELGARLRELREKAGLSLGQVARKLGVSRQAVWKIEEGQSGSSLERLMQLAQAIGAHLEVEVKEPVYTEGPNDAWRALISNWSAAEVREMTTLAAELHAITPEQRQVVRTLVGAWLREKT